jgi:hypothetical protein
MKLKTITIGSELYESVKRLNNFMWTREIFKRIIMTYPYNTSLVTKIQYICNSEHLILVNTTEEPMNAKEILRKERKMKKVYKNYKNLDNDENIKIIS